MRRTRRSAFTLLELLVVLGIIMMLAGLLFPLIGRFKEAGKRAQCLGNLRSLTQAWIAYAGDNGRYLCSPDKWKDTLSRYLPNTSPYRCPDDTSSTDLNPFSYAINGYLNGPVGNPFPIKKIDDIPASSRTFVFIEQAYPMIVAVDPNHAPTQGGAQISGVFSTPIYPGIPLLRVTSWPGQNHKGNKAYAEGTGISFADGHAIFWQYSDTRTGSLQESFASGLNGPLYTNGQVTPLNKFPFLTNSPDVFQLMAWSGGPLPPDPPKSYDPTQPWP